MDHARTSRIDGGRPTPGTRLDFAGDLEQEYRAEHLRRIRHRARLWQAIEVFVAPTIAFLYDGTRGADDWQVVVLVCLSIGFLLSLVLAAFVWLRYDARKYLPVAAWLTPLRSMAYAVVIAHIVDVGGMGTAVLTASTFGHFFFAGLLFHQAAISALGMFVAYAGALTLYEVPIGLTVYALVTVAAVQTMAAVVAHDAQRASRIAFLEHGAVRSKAERDGLTGLRNLRDFDERFAAFWSQALAGQEPLTVLMIDVDHFKAYNDRYGHQAGDEVLRRIAQAIRLAARSGDVVARYGGEEFVMLGSGLDEAAAAALCERIRSTVQELAIVHEESSCAQVVTVSIGAAHVMPQPERSPEGVLQLADENLYRAKGQGRNAYVLHGAEYESLRTGRFRHKT